MFDESSPTKVALLGLGKIGMDYDLHDKKYTGTAKSHLGALCSIPGMEVTYAVDLVPRNLSSTEITVINEMTFDMFVKEPLEYDLLIVAIPTREHLSILKKVIGVHEFPNLIIEKPCGSNLSECLEILDLIKQNSILMQINYFRSALPHTIRALEYVKELNQKPISVEINGYGEILNIFSHFIHLLLLFTDSESVPLQSIASGSKYACLNFATGMNVFVKNIGGVREDLPIVSISYEDFLLDFCDNGRLITVKKRGDDLPTTVFQLDTFERCQELATLEYMRRLKLGFSENEQRILKVHELVGEIRLSHV